jgi:hypothetical protein
MALAIRMGIYGSGHIMAKHSVGVLGRRSRLESNSLMKKTAFKYHFVHYGGYPVFEIAQ